MIQFKINNSTAGSFDLCLMNAIKDAVTNQEARAAIFENDGSTEEKALNLDQFIYWGPEPTKITDLGAKDTVTDISYSSEKMGGMLIPDIKHITLAKLHNGAPASMSADDWTKLLTIRYEDNDNKVVVPPISYPDGKHMVITATDIDFMSKSQSFLKINNLPSEDTFLAFGFTMFFRFETGGNGYFGKIDPIVKITSQG